MKILLVDVDSKIPNLALMKISTYYKNKGFEIELIKLGFDYYPHKRETKLINAEGFEKVFVSIIFPINKNTFKIVGCEDITLGGTGIDLSINLPQDIDDCEEDYSIYPANDCSYGFITRGCIRNCYFCFVPRKEGLLKEYRTPQQIIKHKKVIFMDNNFLAWKGCDDAIIWLRDNKIVFQFNQGLDIRLINPLRAKLLSECKTFGEIYFAFDDIKSKAIIEEKMFILRKWFKKDWKFKFFIYCNANMPINEVTERINWCKENKVLPYLMRDINCWDSPNVNIYTDLCAWCNQPSIFKKMTFEEFIIKRTNNIERQESSKALYNLQAQEVPLIDGVQ